MVSRASWVRELEYDDQEMWGMFGGDENALKLYWWVYNTVNILKVIKLYTLGGWII